MIGKLLIGYLDTTAASDSEEDEKLSYLPQARYQRMDLLFLLQCHRNDDI
jgi:hypothetical protein